MRFNDAGLKPGATQAKSKATAKSKQRRVRAVLQMLLAITFVAAQCNAVGPTPDLPDPGNPRMTRDQQRQIGLQAAAEVYKQMPVLPDSSPEAQYIKALGKRLVDVIPPAHSWPFEFHVIAQKEINAFALPGGPMFVNIGTITAAKNEAELAGVMSHEMAHVYMQHSAKQQDKSSLLSGLAGLAGAVAGAMGGAAGTLAQAGIQVGAGTLMLKYSRGDEAQADAVGAIIMWKAGLNPLALADFFETLAKQGGQGPQFLSDHPNPGNRHDAIQAEIKDWPPKQFSGNTPEFDAARKHAEGVRAYSAQEIADGAKSGQWVSENQKNGAVFAGVPAAPGAAAAGPAPGSAPMPAVPIAQVQPSARFVNTNLGGMFLIRPENWDVVEDQQTSATIAPRAGVSNSGVAYGVVIRADRAPANMNLGQLTSAVVQSLQQGDPRLRPVSQIQGVSLAGGIGAGSVEMETVSPMAGPDGKAQAEHDWLLVVPRGGTVVYFVFVSPLASYNQMRPSFQRMAGSIRFQ
jgi:Zn-dependent protease with chaperone function